MQLILHNPGAHSLQIADNGIHPVVPLGEGGCSSSIGLGGGPGPRRNIPPYQFLLLGHGTLIMVEVHHTFFLGVLMAHHWL